MVLALCVSPFFHPHFSLSRSLSIFTQRKREPSLRCRLLPQIISFCFSVFRTRNGDSYIVFYDVVAYNGGALNEELYVGIGHSHRP